MLQTPMKSNETKKHVKPLIQLGFESS